MGALLLLALWAAVYPTLLAMVTIMLMLPQPRRLLAGYLAGAMLMSVGVGLLIVFALDGSSSATKTVKHTIAPAVEVTAGVLILALALAVATGHDHRFNERRARKREAAAGKPPSRMTRAMQKGSPRTTFVVGAVLTLPGVTYLAALDILAKKDYSTAATVALILLFNLIMLLLLEFPLIGFAVAPDRTMAAVESFQAFLKRDGGRIAVGGAILLGVALIVLGAVHAFA